MITCIVISVYSMYVCRVCFLELNLSLTMELGDGVRPRAHPSVNGTYHSTTSARVGVISEHRKGLTLHVFSQERCCKVTVILGRKIHWCSNVPT